MFGSLPHGLALGRPALSPRWGGVIRTLASSTAGILFAAGLVGVAGLGLAPEPPVTAVVGVVGEVAQPFSDRAVTAPQLAPPLAVAVTAPPVATAIATAEPAIAAPATAAPATAAPAAEPPPAEPVPAAPAVEAAPYRSGGRAYAALTAEPGAELASPITGRAEVRSYQLINGEIRTGANVPSLPYYPYVVVRGPDRVLTLRPGALGIDSEILVRDGAAVGPGTPLVRVTGGGASSWRTFYDRSLQAQVVASFTTAAGTDLDAVPLFRH